jgi:hypothetical protein
VPLRLHLRAGLFSKPRFSGAVLYWRRSQFFFFFLYKQFRLSGYVSGPGVSRPAVAASGPPDVLLTIFFLRINDERPAA